jgi:flagellar biosynthesis regulator FlbT
MVQIIEGKKTNLKFNEETIESICNQVATDVDSYISVIENNVIIERINTISRRLKDGSYYEATLMSFPIIDRFIKKLLIQKIIEENTLIL